MSAEPTGPGAEPRRPGDEREAGSSSAEEEPVTVGTLFVMLLFLMALAGMWALMYLVLLER